MLSSARHLVDPSRLTLRLAVFGCDACPTLRRRLATLQTQVGLSIPPPTPLDIRFSPHPTRLRYCICRHPCGLPMPSVLPCGQLVRDPSYVPGSPPATAGNDTNRLGSFVIRVLGVRIQPAKSSFDALEERRKARSLIFRCKEVNGEYFFTPVRVIADTMQAGPHLCRLNG